MKRRSFLRTAGLAFSGMLTTGSLRAREIAFRTWYTLAVPSQVKNARPIPPFEPFSLGRDSGIRLLVLGDWGTGGKSQVELARKMVKTGADYGCDFVISTGDNIYPKGVQSVEDPQWTRKFVNVYYGQGLTQPFFPTLGNHDYGFEPDMQIHYSRINPQWKFPSRYYTQSLTAKDGTTVQIFSLDTQLVQTGVKGAAEEQREWLDQELGKSTAQWKLVFGHHMLYSNGVYGNLKRMRDAFEETLIRHKVPVYLCGHDHDIQLLKPVNGVSYLISGGGGGHRDTEWDENTIYAATNMGYVWMGVTKEGIHFHFHDASGAIKYAHRLVSSQ